MKVTANSIAAINIEFGKQKHQSEVILQEMKDCEDAIADQTNHHSLLPPLDRAIRIEDTPKAIGLVGFAKG